MADDHKIIKVKVSSAFHKKFRDKVMEDTSNKKAGGDVLFSLIKKYVNGEVKL